MTLQQQDDRNQRVERQQALRVRRLLVSVAVYVPCSAFLALVAWLGYLPAGFMPLWVATFAATNLMSVSYTHLDVYKRQVSMRTAV